MRPSPANVIVLVQYVSLAIFARAGSGDASECTRKVRCVVVSKSEGNIDDLISRAGK